MHPEVLRHRGEPPPTGGGVTCLRRFPRGAILGLVLLVTSGGLAAWPGVVPLRPDPSRLREATPELQERLREDPLVYFRFVNAEWAGRVCAEFREVLHLLPSVILHGDAHVEQYAVTATERGLDDFDDAARGPSVIDTVRFLGSVELIARRRGWIAEEKRVFDAFFDGYTRALADPAYLPPDPAVVQRLRARVTRSREEYFAWSESLMQPASVEELAAAASSLVLVEGLVRLTRPELALGYFSVKKIGWLRSGVGSALTRKVLARIEGPTASPSDDLLLEAKELSRLAAIPCLQVPVSGDAFRVINATKQIGRIRHDILLVVPRRDHQGPDGQDWWIRSWDETYREVVVADLASAEELAELTRDAGAQLGAANLRASSPVLEGDRRRQELAAVRRLAPRIRATARRLTDELLAGWEELRTTQPR
jgi:hypothetical protein